MQVAAMQRWNTHEGIQVAGSRLLGRLSMDEGVVSLCLPPLAPSCIIAHHHHHTTTSDKSGQLLPRPPPIDSMGLAAIRSISLGFDFAEAAVGQRGRHPFLYTDSQAQYTIRRGSMQRAEIGAVSLEISQT